jgi:L-ascorbate metabolism protein UlaG (beta-lactamase superfamily)
MKRLAVVAMLCVCLGAFAEDAPAPIDPRLSADDDAYMNRQAEALLAEVDDTLGRVLPQLPEPAERRLALRVMDGVVHDAYVAARPAAQDFYHKRMERAIAAMESTKVDEGATIWKLYNHGFVVRTATVTVGFDLQRGARGSRVVSPTGDKSGAAAPGFPIPDALADRLVKQCDVLFVSHKHGDHLDPYVVQAFLDQGKPVVTPPDALEGSPLYERITHLKREVDLEQTLPLQGGAQKLKVVVFPGQQYQNGGPMCNVVLVTTPEGLSFVHTGDQINDPYPDYQKDFEWIDKVKDHHKVDVLMVNCWTNDILRTARGFDPKLVVPGHENELGHPVWDRIPYWGDTKYINSNYLEMKKAYPTLVMTWGESYHYTQAAK